MKALLNVLVILCVGSVVYGAECPTDQKAIFCYYTSWSIYREEYGHFRVEDIDPNLCTHLVYAFSGLSIYGGIESLDTYSDISLGGYYKFIGLKEQNPCLKTLMAIGGWNQGSRAYSVMVSDEEYRKDFIDSVIRFLVAHGFDGLDIDWEYPAQRGGRAEDKENFAALLKELKETLQKWDLLLTIAVPIASSIIEAAYDMNAVKNYVDYVLIMGYDYTPTNSPVTGLLSPLLEIDKSVKLWTDVVPSTKIVLGVPAYGRSFTLADTKNHGLGAATSGPGVAGTFTKEPGFLSYFEVVAKLLSRIYTVVPNPSQQNYYAYYGDDWITFELKDNYIAKTNYVLQNNLGGLMVWSIDTDDFSGTLNSTYAIVNTIRNTLYA